MSGGGAVRAGILRVAVVLHMCECVRACVLTICLPRVGAVRT